MIGYFIFLFIQIILGDTLKDALDKEYQLERYFNINVIIFSGLAAIFGISIFINVVFLGNYKLGPKLVSNLATAFLTLILLFALSGISIITTYSSEYSQLDLWGQIRASTNFYSFYSIYILANPTWFWLIALIIYHGILIVFIKYLYARKVKGASRDD
jgi:hypothetical protein